MKKLFAITLVFTMLGACTPRTDAERAEVQRLFDKCMDQAAAIPKSPEAWDTTEAVIKACQAHAEGNL